MSVPRVSIGLPVFNGQKYLEQAIASLLAQSFTDFELIICDNASTDKTETIARQFVTADSRVQYHRNEKNLGANPNFNKALSLARGQYFKWAAYDDKCEPDYLARCVEALDRDPVAMLAHTKTAIIDETGHLVDLESNPQSSRGQAVPVMIDPPRCLDVCRPSRRLYEILLRTRWCFEIFALFRTDALRAAGGMGNFYGADKVLLANVALRGTFLTIDQPLFLRRFHAAQSSLIGSAAQRATWSGSAARQRLASAQRQCFAGYWHAVRTNRMSLYQRLMCHAVLARYLVQPTKITSAMRASLRGLFADEEEAITQPQATR